MSKLFIMVGASGSGKTFMAGEIAKEENCLILSSDAIRAELWGDENDQRNPEKVFQILNEKTFESLKWGMNVVYDATNLRVNRRSELIAQMRKANSRLRVVAVVMATPKFKCIERDEERSRTVGKSVIEKQFAQYEAPSMEEGFDEIRTVF